MENKPVKTMAAHQPLFFPYLGYFDRMLRCDVFVIRDDTQFAKRNFHHRNRIRVPNSPGDEPKLKWLTVPVDHSPIPLVDVKIKNEVRLKKRTWQADLGLQLKGCYGGAPHFKTYGPKLLDALNQPHELLVDLNLMLLNKFCEWFGIRSNVVRATEVKGFAPTGDPSQDLVELTRCLDCERYLSGDGAKVYIRPEPFEEAGIELDFQGYTHPQYEQQGQDFVPYLACVDALFHVGSYPDRKP